MKKKEAILTGAIVIIAIYTLTISLATQVFPALQTTRTLSSSGTIQTIGVGVYVNAGCINALSAIPWGNLEPGASEDFMCYIRNEGSSPSTLFMSTSNWNPPEAGTYLTLSWNYGGQTLNPGEVIQITFTLTVSASIEGVTSFSFDITIVGSG